MILGRNDVMRPCRLRFGTRILLCLCGCGVALLTVIFTQWPHDEEAEVSETALANLKQDILSKSVRYVKVLADMQRVIDQDHAYSGYSTGYDLKKTLAVVLESLLSRVDRLEKSMGRLLNKSSPAPTLQPLPKTTLSVGVIDILSGRQEHCPLPKNLELYPDCLPKVKWMIGYWKSDPCYASYGVDGSNCSFLIYLSEVEEYCPPLPWRPPSARTKPTPQIAEAQMDLERLFSLMNDNPTNFKWIKTRMQRIWPKWKEAHSFLSRNQNWTLNSLKRQRILIHLGFLTKESGFKFGEKSMKGGPLGELVQWTDLISALFILGHQLVISSEIRTFISFAQADPALKSSCPVIGASHVDIIFTDIVGLRQMKKKIPGSLQNYKCRLRVLDSFGTQAEFNSASYFQKHKKELGGKPKNAWGGHGLNLKQFMTMFPHSPDNTFLGFVVETFPGNGSESLKRSDSAALIYGKEAYMWKGLRDYIDTIKEEMEVHTTLPAVEGDVPSYVLNHGVLGGEDFHRLLSRVKVFVGLGFPYEGPAPLEAIANGALFINPSFPVPKGRLTDKFFAEKPTLRNLKSQNPYAEEFIGAPFVITVDVSNRTAVKEALRRAKGTRVRPFLPYEMTFAGMLERVNAFVTHLDFCRKGRNWPPFSASRLVLSDPGDSCKDACWTSGFVCEPSFFPKINNLDSLKGLGSSCTGAAESVDSVWAPAWAPYSGHCSLQNSPLLFSCASRPPTSVRRLCPCRDFIKDQVALCAACL